MKEEKLLQEIGKWLNKKGWKVAVISFKGIAKSGMLKNNYSLIVDFTGKNSGVEE